MTTIFAISDTHICATSPRWPECQRVLGWFANLALSGADLVIHCGDLYDRASTPVDRAFAASWLMRIASACPVIVVRGNHDVSRDLEILAALSSEHPIHVCEQPTVIVEAGVVVQCLPWPRVAELAARTGATGADLDERAREALRDVLRGLECDARSLREGAHRDSSPDAPVILATHALITGAITSHGQPLVGGELALGLADLALAEADVMIAGHIHAPQQWDHGGKRIAYCGSPFATAFGEHEGKSVVRLGVEDDGRVSFSRIVTPAQRMIDVRAEVADPARDPSAFGLGDLPSGPVFAHDGHRIDVAGHQVRLRYVVEAGCRELARAEAAKLRDGWLAAGAERVVVEPEVLVASTARAPEIARATTVREQLESMWVARSDRPPDADGVLSALAEIEEG